MKCNNCKREGCYVRLRTQESVCQKCGHIEPLPVTAAAGENKPVKK